MQHLIILLCSFLVKSTNLILSKPTIAQSAKTNLMNKFNTPTATKTQTPAKKTTFNSAKATVPTPSTSTLRTKLFQSTTPSMAKQAITNRMISNMKTANGKIMTSAYPTTPSTKQIVVNDKRISRTVDCAKSIKRRSINFLNNVNIHFEFRLK
jgi:hypothetical protein